VKDGKLISAQTFWDDVEKIFSTMDSEEGFPDRSVRQFLNGVNAAEEDKAAALRYVEGFNAAEADRLGMQGLIQSCRAEAELGGDDLIYRLIGGYGPLVDAIAGELKRTQIKMNTAVREIQWRRGHVSVHWQSEGGEVRIVRAKTALITLPLGVLQQAEDAPNAVRFEPRLESKKSALERLVMGKVVRVALLFKSRFWDSVQVPESERTLESLNFLHNAENKYFPTWWTQTPIRMPVLIAWSSGRFAENLANLSDAQISRHAVDALCSWMPVERGVIEAELLQCYLHNWQNDPFSQGAYSYPGVGGKEAQVELAQPVEDTLFFAGEATDTDGSFATVHGAMKTGLRAAQEAQRVLNSG
jgi:monoamine oxidase